VSKIVLWDDTKLQKKLIIENVRSTLSG